MKRSLLLTSIIPLFLACSDDTSGNSEGGSGSGAADSTSSASTGGTGGSGAGGSGGEAVGTGGAGGVDPFAGPLVNLQEVDFGTKEIDTVHKINLPDRMVGFTLLAEANGVVGVYSVRAKNKLFAISGFGIPNTGLQSFAGQDIVGAAIPQSDLADVNPPPAGEWQFRLGAEEQNPITAANVRLFVRRTNDGAFHGGVIDFNVFIASSSSASQSYINSVLNNLFANYYGALGLSLGTVTFSTIANSSFNTISSTTEYRQLLESSAGAGSEPAVNLFVVSGFSGAELGGVLGIAGGIPGAPVKHGTTMSGVAYDPQGDAAYDASVLAHEIGHLGGLFHTTEYQVTAVDPLADTPSCANPQNPNSCPDVSNVMFPIAYGGNVFSTWQGKVLQASVLYRGSLSEGAPPSGPLPAPANPNTDFAKPYVATRSPLEAITVRSPNTPLERLLWSHWCANAGDPTSLVLRAADEVGGMSALESILRDETAIDIARARALRVMSNQVSSAEDAFALAATIEDVLYGKARHRLISEAVSSLETLDPSRLDALGIVAE